MIADILHRLRLWQERSNFNYKQWFERQTPYRQQASVWNRNCLVMWCLGYVSSTILIFCAGLLTNLFGYTNAPTLASTVAFCFSVAAAYSLVILAVWFFKYPKPPASELFPFRASLEARLRQVILEHDYAIPSPEAFHLILTVGEQLYNTPRNPPTLITLPKPADEAQAAEWTKLTGLWTQSNQLILDAIVKSLSAYVAQLPRFNPAPFQKPFSDASGSLIYDLVQPFREEPFRLLGLTNAFVDRFNQNVGAYTQTVKRATETLWPHRYQGKQEEMADTYLRGTPFQLLFNVLVPYDPFTDEMRFTHHWCMGDTGSGKSTFLRHLIKHDLDRVAKEECSLVVIDSKSLAREMRTLKRFDAGEDLDGRVIIIDDEQVFPLNPFHLPKEQGAKVLTYMLAHLQDASELQSGALLFYIDAAFSFPNPTLYTVQHLLDLPDKVVPKELEDDKKADSDTIKWFKNTRHTLHRATSGGIKQRLAIFLKQHKHGLAAMFNANGWKLDMHELHQGGKVLLVDTNREKNGADGAALLGRLIISLLDQLATRRNRNPGPPLFCYIDEAQDYIPQDPIFADILEKARSSKVGMTVAHHHLKQGGGFLPGVVGALEQVGIKTRCERQGSVSVKTRQGAFELPVGKLEFTHEPQNEHYAKLREHLVFLYQAEPAPSPPKPTEQPLLQKFK